MTMYEKQQEYVMRKCEKEQQIIKDEMNGIGDKDIHNLEMILYSIMPGSYWYRRGCIKSLRKAIAALEAQSK